MDDLLAAVVDFFSQPFGAVGAVCIMAAVTALNSRWLADRYPDRAVLTGVAFNGLNLAGGVCLFVNALIRQEVVWLVLEVYFVAIAVKGLTQLHRERETERARQLA